MFSYLEGLKNLQNLHCQFDVYINAKSTVKILWFFVAFLENMNFTYIL